MEKGKQVITQLSDILVKKKAITADRSAELQKLFAQSSINQFEDFLLLEGFVDRDDLLTALSEYYQVPFVDVVGCFFDHVLVSSFPKGFLLRAGVIPLEVDGNMLVVVAANPDESGLESSIREYVSYDIVFRVGLRHDINDAVKEFYDTALSQDVYDDEQ